jgi:hypothetical protein
LTLSAQVLFGVNYTEYYQARHRKPETVNAQIQSGGADFLLPTV